MSGRVAVFGGNFNPPGRHHRSVVEMLTRHFDEVVVVPMGPRPGQVANAAAPIYRATMVNLCFRGLAGVKVELFNLEQDSSTPALERDRILRERGETWHVVGANLVRGGGRGESRIQTQWQRGHDLWRELRWAVVRRDGEELEDEDLPPQARVYELHAPAATSAQIRENLYKQQPVAALLQPQVLAYIERYGLYQGRLPARNTSFNLSEPRALIEVDRRNPGARELAIRFEPLATTEDPNVILVIGGDGTMLHAILHNWRRRVPFLGINAGRRGFLMNDPVDSLERELIVRQLPLLYVETLDVDGNIRQALGFNDAWAERQTGQTAWLEVKVNDVVRLSRLVGDGVLISTAAGSTAYARAMGATPLLVDTEALLLVGNNVGEPASWKSAHLPLDSVIAMRSLDPDKRPVRAFVDGVLQGEMLQLTARVSRIAAAELAFSPQHDVALKLSQIQFPQDA